MVSPSLYQFLPGKKFPSLIKGATLEFTNEIYDNNGAIIVGTGTYENVDLELQKFHGEFKCMFLIDDTYVFIGVKVENREIKNVNDTSKDTAKDIIVRNYQDLHEEYSEDEEVPDEDAMSISSGGKKNKSRKSRKARKARKSGKARKARKSGKARKAIK